MLDGESATLVWAPPPSITGQDIQQWASLAMELWRAGGCMFIRLFGLRHFLSGYWHKRCFCSILNWNCRAPPVLVTVLGDRGIASSNYWQGPGEQSVTFCIPLYIYVIWHYIYITYYTQFISHILSLGLITKGSAIRSKEVDEFVLIFIKSRSILKTTFISESLSAFETVSGLQENEKYWQHIIWGH